ncbi:MAG: hypothetical protein KJ971_07195 [Firmicutes bacterium]|nr:hypothetical protein [Bacillota bacterium]
MKLLKNKFVRILLMIFEIILVLLVTINFPITNFSDKVTDTSYESWMSETLDSSDLIKDVALLGAHDAFTSKISYFSQVDLLSADSIQTGITGALIKGFSVKQSRTQVSVVEDLLNHGVRYFDIRLTYNDSKEAWYTSHTYFSLEFYPILETISVFLEDHPGEFILLDIQHVNGADYEDESTFLEIYQLFEDSGILDFAYPDNLKDTSLITYADVTSNLTKAGVLIFSKFNETSPLFWSYGYCIRSAWPNLDQFDEVFLFLEEEASLIETGNALTGNQMSENLDARDSQEAFRVMQAVVTMQMNGTGIVNALLTWSLLERAKDFNHQLLEQTQFLTWLETMPIVMVDYADTNSYSFNDELMQIIIDFNQN